MALTHVALTVATCGVIYVAICVVTYADNYAVDEQGYALAQGSLRHVSLAHRHKIAICRHRQHQYFTGRHATASESLNVDLVGHQHHITRRLLFERGV